MRDPKQLRDKAFELRRRAVHARTDASAVRLIDVAREAAARARRGISPDDEEDEEA
jgi:hypothetical protein